MFRWWALAVFVVVVGISGYARRRAHVESGKIARRREAWPLILGRLAVSLPLFGAVVAYLVHPPLMNWSSVEVPEWVPWLGVALGVAAIPGAVWLFRSIGSNVSETVLTKASHTLVTHGPYAWIRHPLYTNGVALFLAVGLMASNWFILLCAVVALLSIRLAVVPIEERALIEKFGQRYVEYRRRTGAMWPRFGSRG
jgi:protein-S-isoprenylcysteine O-methyltransferase Ste14